MPEQGQNMPAEAGGAHGGPGNRTPVVDVRNVVEKLLERLEEGGVDGVHAWFVGRPHILVQQQKAGRYNVLMWREGVAIEIELNENKVEMVRLIVCHGN